MRRKITDKQRLDWLEKNITDCGIYKDSMSTKEKFCLGGEWFPTIREAIDAEIRKTTKGVGSENFE